MQNVSSSKSGGSDSLGSHNLSTPWLLLDFRTVSFHPPITMSHLACNRTNSPQRSHVSPYVYGWDLRQSSADGCCYHQSRQEVSSDFNFRRKKSQLCLSEEATIHDNPERDKDFWKRVISQNAFLGTVHQRIA